MVTKDKKWWTFEILGPSMIYNRFNGEISCHHITVSLHHRITASLSVSHLPCPLPPNQSVICLAPCHQTSQSFALPPATKPVSHLPCPLPLRHCITASPCHCITALLCHRATTSPCHRISQSFALPPATKPVSHLPCPLPPHPASPHHHVTTLVSHLPCPLPPNQSVICLAPYHRITTSPHHRITTLVSHLPCPLPPSQSVICLAPYHRVTALLR